MSAERDPNPGDDDAERSATPPPDITKTMEFFRGPVDIRSIALTGLFVLALIYSVYVARAVLMPVTLAFIFSFLLTPVVNWLQALRVPRSLATALVLSALLAATIYGAVRLVDPAAEWLDRAPDSMALLEARLEGITREVERLSEATESVEGITQGDRPEEAVAVVEGPSLSDRLFSSTRAVVGGSGVLLVLTYFLLVSGDLFLRKLVRVIPRLRDKKRAVEIARQMQEHISGYLLTISAINVGLAIVQGVALWLLGVPNPLLWGVMAGLLNYIPYIGPVIGTAVLGFVALLAFEELSRALVVPAVYLGISILEGNLVTPVVLGRSLTLNPVVIFIWVLFWGWLWGIVGTLVAVPLLAAVKIFCDHIEPLAPIGEFLGE